jgi:type IV pilus assembly protein PilA
MLARIRKSQEAEGFTLIELLVVMIIIGILAAIAIPVFLNQRKKAQDSAAKADVSTLGKEIATYYVEGVGNDADGKPVITVLAADQAAVAASSGVAASGAVPKGHYSLAVGAVTGPPAQDAITASDLGKASSNVVIKNQFYSSDTAWCISVQNPKGDQAVAGYKYSAAGGLAPGICTNANG